MARVPHTGGMVALVPSAADVERLAVDHPDAETPDELHLTLGFLGDDVRDWPPESRETLIREMTERAGPAITARIMGHAVFNPDGGPDGDRTPCQVYLVGDSPALAPLVADVHGMLSDKIGVPAQHTPWVGHVTGGYGLPDKSLSYTGPVTFDRLRVALAGQHYDIPLTPAAEEPGGEPDPDDIETKIDEKGAPVDGIEQKNKVATDAGAARYKVPIGTELGQARNAQAQQAQNNTRAKDQYDTFVNADPKDRRAMLDDLSAADLKALAAITYSFRSSNPKVVASRVALAGALKRNGLDVNSYGGLGGSARGTGAAKRKTGKTAGKTTAPRSRTKRSTTGAASARTGINARGTSVDADKISDGERDRYLAAGWRGDPNDGSETLYAPGTHKAVKKKSGEPEDVEQSGAAVDHEEKARTTSKPWKTGDIKRQGHTVSKAKGDEGDKYPIKTIGDIAAAVKRANSIKDKDQLAKVRAHIRKEAARLKAPNMIPAAWSTGGAEKKDAGAAVVLDSDRTLLAGIETKMMSPQGTKLREYWAHGEGRAKWAPGTPGDFERLKKAVRKFVPAHMLNGFVANVHKLATGEWPGKNAHGGKSGNAGDLEFADLMATVDGMGDDERKAVTIPVSELADLDTLDDDDPDPDDLDTDDPDAGVDDAMMALDRYDEMDAGNEITAEEEYEQALADEVDWELDGDGEPHPVAGGGPDGDGDEDDVSMDKREPGAAYDAAGATGDVAATDAGLAALDELFA